MDIAKGRSIVEQFLLAGFDVFLLDWGREQNKNITTISDYIVCIDDAIEQVKALTGSRAVSLLGYSWGGVLSITYTAINSKK